MHTAPCNNFPMIEILKERQSLEASHTFETLLWVAACYGTMQWVFNQHSAYQ